jgi:hypothetical protein
MLKFIRFLQGSYALPDDAVLTADRADMRAVAEAARLRLEQQGLFQVELDAQREIAKLVREGAHLGRAGDEIAA